MNVKVSIIIPVYNNEDVIERCLDSLLKQTLKEIELIIINDGSTDSTADILSKYKNNHSNIQIINQSNRGPSAARNAGMAIAKGKYIGFCDSDDYVSEDMYEKMYTIMESENVDLVCCGRYEFDHNKIMKQVLSKDTLSNFSLTNNSEILYKTTYYIWDKIFKKEIIDKYNIIFPSNIYYAEDCYFLTIYKYYSKKIYIIREALYYYNKNTNDSITNTFNSRWSHIYEILSQINEFFLKKGKFYQYENELFELSYDYFRRRIKDLRKYSNKNLQLEFVDGFCDYFNQYFPNWKKAVRNKKRIDIPRYMYNKKYRRLYIYSPGIIKSYLLKLDKFLIKAKNYLFNRTI